MQVIYFRYLLRIGLPIIGFFVLAFSILFDFKTGIELGLANGIFFGIPLSLIAAFIKNNKDNLKFDTDFTNNQTAAKRINVLVVLSPFFVMLLGAVIARVYKHALAVSVVTIMLSAISISFLSYRTGDYHKALKNETVISYIFTLIFLSLRYIIIYAFFIFILCGFNPEEVKKIF